MKSEREQLIDLLNLYSIKYGEDFVLASGEKSNVYVDVKKTSQLGIFQKSLAKLLWDKILKEFKKSPDNIAGVALGGCHLASIIAMHAPVNIDVLHIRKQAKDHGTKNLIEGPMIRKYSSIVLIEDVVTTGASSIAAAKVLEEAGADLLGIISVVDRRKEKKSYLNLYPFYSLCNFEELTV